MLVVQAILGTIDEPRFRARTVERLPVGTAEAARPRLRRRTDRGTDVAIDLPRRSYLRDGAVLADDGERVVVVERAPEKAAIVRLPATLSRAELASTAVRLGHAFGNQHVPLEIEDDEIRIPVTTSETVVSETLRSAGIDAGSVRFEIVPLGRERPLTVSHSGS